MSAFSTVWAILLTSIVILGRVHCLNEALFHRQRGKYLANHVIRTHQTRSEFECSTFCSTEASCASLNYKATGDGQGLCELNNESLSDPPGEHGMDIPEFNHLGIVKRNCEERQQVFSQNTKKCVDVRSCKEALKEDGSLSSGIYYLKELRNSAAKKYPVYCQMSDIVNCGGGAWTLVLKMDGSKSTFKYDSPYWSDMKTYGYLHDGLEGLTDQEIKLASYWNTPFQKICLGMKVEGVRKWIKLDYEASSLYSVIADGTFRGTNAGRSTWKALIDESSLQMNCNREGFNIHLSSTNLDVRLGIVSNNQNSCVNPDSYIGFGVSAYICSKTSGVTCGNIASCGGNDNGHKTTAAIGYILVK